MTQTLEDRIWQNAKFHDAASRLNLAWLQRELGLEQTYKLADDDLVRCSQAAVILSSSNDPARQRAAFSIAACANALFDHDLPGTAGVLRIVLTKMGNFPATATSQAVTNFTRLPTSTAIAEETRRYANSVQIGAETLVLTDFQRELWNVLISRENVGISAPTSAGKSFVLQLYLRSIALSGKLGTAIYLVPSRALIAQVTEAVSAWRKLDGLHDLTVINVPLTAEVQAPSRAIYVLTQERLRAIMDTHPSFAAETIISDEAQSIQEGSRGILLQNVIDGLIERSGNAQLIFAGPNLKNPSMFREIFGLQNLREVQSRAPSVVQNLISIDTRTVIKGRINASRFTRTEREALGTEEIGRYLPSIKERLVRIAERFGQNKPSIVYANRPSDAEGVAIGLAEVFSSVEPSERLVELSEFVKFAVHEEYDLAPCLLRGVGFHYGRIPALVRRGVESAFADGEIRFLVTTSTLIQGVNFPAANLFVCQPKKGQITSLDAAEFWNLAGRAGRLGKEFQGNIFLIDYDSWQTALADTDGEIEIQSYLKSTLANDLDALEACALDENPKRETDGLADVEAAFARLLSDHMKGRLVQTFDRCEVGANERVRLTKALEQAKGRVSIPATLISASPTVSAFRQQRLAKYLESEIKGGGIKRLQELMPRHPRDPDAWIALSEIYRVCHEYVLTFSAPRLHLRMAAISLSWMRGDTLPEIINENHKRSGGKSIASSIRNTLNDIEQEIRFKYLRLVSCYIAVLRHVLESTGHKAYLDSLPALPAFLEVGASDQTMISLISLGLSRMSARLLTQETMDKEMDIATALRWLRSQDLEKLRFSSIVISDIRQILGSLPAT